MFVVFQKIKNLKNYYFKNNKKYYFFPKVFYKIIRKKIFYKL